MAIAEMLGGGKGVSVVISATDNFSRTFGVAQTKMAAFKPAGLAVAAGFAAIGIGVAGVAAATVKTAIDFESAFAGVRKTVDLTAAEFDVLDKSLRDMTTEIPTTYTELASIAEIAGQLGVEGVDNIAIFTKTIADISETTNLTAERAATDFARIASIMGEPIENIDRMGAAIVELGNNFETSETEISEFATRIAATGKIAGLTTSDIFAISAAFTSVGIQAEAGGTAVQKVLTAMTESSAGLGGETIDNTEKITKLNKKLEDMREKLTSATTKSSDYADNMKSKTTEAIEDMKNKLKIATLQMSEFTDKTKESTKVSKQQRIDKYTANIAELEAELVVLNNTQGDSSEAMLKYGKNISELESELVVLNKAHGQAKETGIDFASVLGVTQEKYAQMFKEDPAGTFTKFVEKLGTEGDKAFKILDDLELGDQRLVRAFLSVGAAGTKMADSLETASKAWEDNTALTEEAEKRYETLESQIQLVKNELTLFAAEIGEKLMPIVRDQLLPLVKDKLIPLLGRIFDKILPIIKNDVIPLIEKYLIPAVKSLIDFTKDLIEKWKNLSPEMKTAIKIGTAAAAAVLLIAAAGAILSIVLGVLLSPLILIAVAIGAAVAAGYLLAAHWDDLKEKAKELGAGLKNVFIGVRNSVVSVWDEIVNVIARSINKVVNMINNLIRSMNKVPGVNIGQLSNVSLTRFKSGMMDYESYTAPRERQNPIQNIMNVIIDNLNGFNARDIANHLQDELNKKITMG